MAVLTVTNLGKSYGPVDIFSGISFSVAKRARIGLVGPNGVGKTTLLRLLVGEETASAGEVFFSSGIQAGYLPQEAKLESDRTLWEECLSVFRELLQRQEQLRKMEQAMSAGHASSEDLIADYGRLQAEFDFSGGYQYETRIRQTLTGLGFSKNDETRPLQQLSGGERTRALLAKLLLQSADILLLDEPTNHLDIAAVEWLESYLKDWSGAVLIVSHDRYFLDQVTTQIWEMTPVLETYKGNYSAYLQQRGERYARQMAEFDAQQEFIEKEEEFIRRNIAGQNTRQAKGRRKRLERMMEEARLAPPPNQRRPMHLNLDASGRSGEIVLRTSNLMVGYEDEGKPLFCAPDLLLKRKECAAIIGPNGAGKTTFLKTILAQIAPLGGQVSLGASLKIGYFAQAHEDLKPGRTLMDEISVAAPGLRPAEIRSYLARFLFSGDDVFKTVENLSGGERGRLALAILALQGANLLLLDEPTNHLDLSSQEILQSMLADFDGTILLVSHDRYLIDALATQIWEVEPDESKLIVFDGTYSEYKEFLLAESQRKTGNQEQSGLVDIPFQEINQNSRNEKNTGLSKNERLRLSNKLEQVEKTIAELEARLVRLEGQLQKPPEDGNMVRNLAGEYHETQEKLADQLKIWEDVATRLEEE